MNPVDQMSDEQLERHALEILRRELGLHGLARFLRAVRTGTGDYTRDRGQWLEGTSVREVAKEISEIPPDNRRAS
jgi:hypothetical protein